MEDLYAVDHIYRNGYGEVQMKGIGVFTGRQKADAALAGIKDMPGFRDHASGFIVEKIVIDTVFWEAGFDPRDADARLLPHHDKP